MRAIFLDRDGVINENRPTHVKSWSEFRFLPRSIDALRLLTRLNYRTFVVTNQAIVNRRVVDHSVIEHIHGRMVHMARLNGAQIAAVRYCPHRTDEHCGCRKPQPGMISSLANEYRLNPAGAFMVGDSLSDVAAARKAGCRPILVRTGRGEAQLRELESSFYRPEVITQDLFAAVEWIAEQELLTRSYHEQAVA